MNTQTILSKITIKKEDRRKLNRHGSVILWFTGLSGAGKSTLAHRLEVVLYERGIRTYILDGDKIRKGLNKDLGFSPAERTENIRRIGEITKLFMDCGIILMAAFISPYRKDRDAVRNLVRKDEFIEIYVKCPATECEKRDVKGLYKKAREGEIEEFTGISAPYEEPLNPHIVIDSVNRSIEENVDLILKYLEEHQYLTTAQ